jgi:hypothetical protein
VTDAGLEHLAALKALEWVNLMGARVTGKGVADLRAALPKCRVFWRLLRREELEASAPRALAASSDEGGSPVGGGGGVVSHHLRVASPGWLIP